MCFWNKLMFSSLRVKSYYTVSHFLIEEKNSTIFFKSRTILQFLIKHFPRMPIRLQWIASIDHRWLHNSLAHCKYSFNNNLCKTLHLGLPNRLLNVEDKMLYHHGTLKKKWLYSEFFPWWWHWFDPDIIVTGTLKNKFNIFLILSLMLALNWFQHHCNWYSYKKNWIIIFWIVFLMLALNWSWHHCNWLSLTLIQLKSSCDNIVRLI